MAVHLRLGTKVGVLAVQIAVEREGEDQMRTVRTAIDQAELIQCDIRQQVREALEWSWNVSAAELMHDNTVKENARWISDGVTPGKEVDEETLVRDFFMCRTDTNGNIDSEWVPDNEEVASALVAMVHE